MKHGFLKTAACSPRVALANPAKNAEEILRVAGDAAEQGAAIAVFPELCLTGYSLGDLFFQTALRDSALEALETIRRGSKKLDCALVVGLPLELDGALYDCAAVVAGGKICGIVPKCVLSAREARVFAAGDDLAATVWIDQEEVCVGSDLIFENCGMFPACGIGKSREKCGGDPACGGRCGRTGCGDRGVPRTLLDRVQFG